MTHGFVASNLMNAVAIGAVIATAAPPAITVLVLQGRSGRHPPPGPARQG